MNSLQEILETENSRQIANIAAAYVGTDNERFETLLNLVFNGQIPVSQRASRVVDTCIEWEPQLLTKSIHYRIITYLLTCNDHTIKRSLMRLLCRHSMVDDDDLLGQLVEKSFEWVQSAEEKVAFKVLAMQVLFNISKKIPELKHELILVIEEQLPYNSHGFKSRGRMLLKKLKKAPFLV